MLTPSFASPQPSESFMPLPALSGGVVIHSFMHSFMHAFS